MKALIFKTLLTVCSGILLLASCDKMEDTYKQYLDDGEIIYTGKADSLRALPGNKRIGLTWLIVSDPKIVKTVVYWNAKRDSVVVPVHKTAEVDTLNVVIPDLEEGVYTFEVYTFDAEGNSSIKTEVIGEVFGDTYQHSLYNREVKQAAWINLPAQTDPPAAAFTGVQIDWFGAAGQAVFVEIAYTNQAGEQIVLRDFPVQVGNRPPQFRETSRLPDYLRETSFSYRTAFKPDSAAMDTFYTDFDVFEPEFPPELSDNLALNKSLFKSSDISAGRVANAIDGDYATFWQTSSADRGDLNVWMTVDLGELQSFNAIKAFWNRVDPIAKYDIWYSDDNENWEIAFTKDEGFSTEEEAEFPTVTARYVQLNMDLKSTINVTTFEFEVYNSD